MNRLHRTSCFNLVARLWLIFNSRENQAHVEETSRAVLHVNVDIKISFAINHFTSYMRNMKKRRKQKKWPQVADAPCALSTSFLLSDPSKHQTQWIGAKMLSYKSTSTEQAAHFKISINLWIILSWIYSMLTLEKIWSAVQIDVHHPCAQINAP